MQRQQSLDEKRVIVEERRHFGAAVPIGVQQRAVFSAKTSQHEVGRALRRENVARLVKALPHDRHPRDHLAVPVGQDLVVHEGSFAQGARGEQRFVHGLETAQQLVFP